MRTASIQEIKQELAIARPVDLAALCLRLAKFRKENKELLSYLLFEAHDEQGYMTAVKNDIDEEFGSINFSHFYFVKKSLRKILRGINKHIRFMMSKQAEAELLIYFCRKMHETVIGLEKSTVLYNIFQAQLKKINGIVSSLHEDLQYEYYKELELLK